jgi:choice-of-anchor A domain-containing protein
MTLSKFTRFGALFILVAAAAPAKADVVGLSALDIMHQLNAVVTNNFSTSSDVEGRLAAGTIKGGATFYTSPNALDQSSSFQAVNAQSITGCSSCNVNNGGSVNYVTGNSGHFNFNAGGGHAAGSLAQNSPAFTMSDLTTPLDALTSQLTGLAANATVNSADPNNFTFDASKVTGDTAVFSLSATSLAAANNILFNVSGSVQTIVIDVTGAVNYAFTQNGNFNGSTFLNEHVIWNFEDAGSLNLKYWHGAILAGDAAVSNSSPLEGFLYASSFAGNGELHDRPFQGALGAAGGTAAAAPEASTWAMLTLGFAGLAFAGYRQRRGPRIAD